MSLSLNYRVFPFDEMDIYTWYEISKLREQVFIQEQNRAYPDADGKDPECRHVLLSLDSGELIGYARVVPPELTNFHHSGERIPSIGRVLIKSDYRGLKAGRMLMEYALDTVRKQFQSRAVFISAQIHLIKFYGDLGFEVIGKEYLEAGTPHLPMKHYFSSEKR